ncbi:MAG: hypothetical protein ACLUH5_05185 [Eubacterium sp.]
MRINHNNKDDNILSENFIYTPEKSEKIINHEEQMFKKYSDIIDEYKNLFKEHNCTLKTGLIWTNFKDECFDNRPPFKNGYLCQIYCEVQQDGREAHTDSTDGEVDYYPLSASWIISSIFRDFFKLKAYLCSSTDDIESDIYELYNLLSNS